MSAPAEDISSSAGNSTPARSRRARWIVAALVLLFLIAALLLPLLNINRYHRTIADSLTRSLGHTVRLGDVNMQIFPLPGLAIHDLIVEEDPSFGAEPLLRAPSVTVFLRLSSLWRQRLEISRINLDNASVNLARDSSGRWNFASLLTQASRTASAPTAQRRPGPALRFPYIEFHSARINFKEGYEKKAFSILNADASVWLADPNQWQIRLEAQPARTDLDLELEGKGTGTIRLEGSVTRAAALDQLPLNLHTEWNGAELGQVSRLIFGADSGWRGDFRAETDIAGDMRNLQLHSRLRVGNVHRLEFTPLNALSMDVRCQAVYHHPQQLLDNLTCLLPTGDGHLLLTGAVATIGHPQPDLTLEINHTPVSSVISAIGLLRRALPSDLAATGTINGQFAWNPQPTGQSGAHPAALTGHAIADTVAIHLAGVDQPFTFAALTFTTPPAVETPQPHRGAKHRKPAQPPLPSGNIILLEPASLAAGAPTPMQVSGQFSRSGFSLHFTGESDLARLQPIIGDISQFRALAALAPQGTAQTDMTFSGPWIPEAPTLAEPADANEEIASPVAALQGWTRLQHAVLKPAWLPEPIEIATATAQFGNQIGNQSGSPSGNATIIWSNVSASVNGIEIRGSASYTPAIFFNASNSAAPCGDQPECSAQINFDFPTLDAAALQSAILGAGRHGELLQAILSRVESPAPPWPALTGTIHAGTLTIGNLKLNNARAAITVRNGRLNILSFDAAALGGSTHVTGSVEAASDGPKYALNLSWTGVQIPEIAALFPATANESASAANANPEKINTEQWGTGSIDGQMNLNLHGYSNLASTAAGDFRWLLDGSWTGAPIPVSALQTNSKPAPWAAAGTIANQTLTLTKGPIQGTITFDRVLNLTLASPNQPPIHIGGTIAQPVTGEPASATITRKNYNPR